MICGVVVPYTPGSTITHSSQVFACKIGSHVFVVGAFETRLISLPQVYAPQYQMPRDRRAPWDRRLPDLLGGLPFTGLPEAIHRFPTTPRSCKIVGTSVHTFGSFRIWVHWRDQVFLRGSAQPNRLYWQRNSFCGVFPKGQAGSV